VLLSVGNRVFFSFSERFWVLDFHLGSKKILRIRVILCIFGVFRRLKHLSNDPAVTVFNSFDLLYSIFAVFTFLEIVFRRVGGTSFLDERVVDW
jgi:hypothetical protein